MKKVLSIAAIAVFALSFASCKKCASCTWESSGYSYETGEFCGKKKDVNNAISVYESYGYTCS